MGKIWCTRGRHNYRNNVGKAVKGGSIRWLVWPLIWAVAPVVSCIKGKNNSDSIHMLLRVLHPVGHGKALCKWKTTYENKGLYLFESFLMNQMVVSLSPDRSMGKWSLNTAGRRWQGHLYSCIFIWTHNFYIIRLEANIEASLMCQVQIQVLRM